MDEIEQCQARCIIITITKLVMRLHFFSAIILFSLHIPHRHAKRLYKLFLESKNREKKKLAVAETRKKKIDIASIKKGGKDGVPILGRCYVRKTRFRNPILPLKLTKLGDGKTINVYNKMKYWDLEVKGE